MLKLEFHCHTVFSKDSLTRPEQLLEAARRKGLDKIVITDHNTIAGALLAWQAEPDRVIIGEEIMTQQGELLAAFVQEEIPAGLPAREAVARLRAQGAFISVSHPFDRLRAGCWELANLEAILPEVDAIEVFNARCMWPPANRQAQAFAALHGLLGTVGSDAHTTAELGSAYLSLPEFQDAASLREALAHALPTTALSPPWVHWFSRYAVWRKAWLLKKKKAIGA